MTLTTNKKTVLLILVAFIFSFSVRLIWVNQFQNTESFKFNNEFMINTNDGYLWAEGARDMIQGQNQSNDLSPFEREQDKAVSQLTAFLAQILPIQFETLIFYMPAFFASLIVIPIILIAREFDRLEAGFIAALIGSIAWSYYNRTMVGYYDTDLLNIVFPTVLLWSLIWAIDTKDEKYFLIAGLDSIAYRWWYPQSYSLEFAFILLLVLYAIYQFIKKEDFKTNLILISFMIFAMVNIDSLFRIAIVIAFFIIIKTKKEIIEKYIYYIFGIAIILFLATGGIDPILGKLQGYIFRDSINSSSEGLGLNFFAVNQTVREAGQIPFETFANRISGHTVTFIISIIGYAWFAYKHRIMLLALPMVGLGFLAYGIPGLINGGGLRFTVYAVPIMALGLGFIIYEVSSFLSKQLINDDAAKVTNYVLMVVFTVAALYPNIKHIEGYKVPTVFNKQEVNILTKLKDIAQREDYAIGWWDYGYPLRYYSDVKTLVDGGKHGGSVNYPVSFILNKPQDIAAKMARLDVEYTEKRFNLDSNTKWANSNIEQMTIDYGFKNSNNFIESLKKDITLPQKTRDIYLYLPNRMMNIFPTVNLFSNIDLMTGNKGKRPFFYKTNRFKDNGKSINLGNNIVLDKQKGTVKIGNQNILLNNFAATAYDKSGKLHKNIKTINSSSPINIIFMKNYNQFLVVDNDVYNSLYIQLFVLENFDKNLFEPVIFDPLAKVYKLKI
jgi:dolichyl-diphosphooligosaccharide--protein glycosyltransferase/undecaprenyl-diphosphooligosaccharide--protein glycosyltransferase